MPFGKKMSLDELHSRLLYENVIQRAVENAGATCTRIDLEHTGKKKIRHELQDQLREADLVIADVTNNNPNVLYELGFRAARRAEFICISDDPATASWWAASYKIINYTQRDAIDEISRSITAILDRTTRAPRILDEHAQLESQLSSSRLSDNAFKERLGAWRIKRAREQIARIEAGEWVLEARPPRTHIASSFEELLDLLDEGEEYLAMSNIDFWSDKAVGEGGFLEANKRAVEREGTIRRVLLIRGDDLMSQTLASRVNRVVHMHREQQQRLREQKAPGTFEVRAFIAEDYDKAIESYGHFGMMCSRNSSIAIYPEYGRTGEITKLNLLLSETVRGASTRNRRIGKFTEQFKRAWSAAFPLDRFEYEVKKYVVEHTENIQGRRVRAKAKGKKGALRLEGAVRQSTVIRGEYKGQTYKARLRQDGRIRYDGDLYETPTAACRAAIGRKRNGWYFWKLRSDKGQWLPLHILRS